MQFNFILEIRTKKHRPWQRSSTTSSFPSVYSSTYLNLLNETLLFCWLWANKLLSCLSSFKISALRNCCKLTKSRHFTDSYSLLIASRVYFWIISRPSFTRTLWVMNFFPMFFFFIIVHKKSPRRRHRPALVAILFQRGGAQKHATAAERTILLVYGYQFVIQECRNLISAAYHPEMPRNLTTAPSWSSHVCDP